MNLVNLSELKGQTITTLEIENISMTMFTSSGNSYVFQSTDPGNPQEINRSGSVSDIVNATVEDVIELDSGYQILTSKGSLDIYNRGMGLYSLG